MISFRRKILTHRKQIMRILIIEDELTLNKMLAEGLKEFD